MVQRVNSDIRFSAHVAFHEASPPNADMVLTVFKIYSIVQFHYNHGHQHWVACCSSGVLFFLLVRPLILNASPLKSQHSERKGLKERKKGLKSRSPSAAEEQSVFKSGGFPE